MISSKKIKKEQYIICLTKNLDLNAYGCYKVEKTMSKNDNYNFIRHMRFNLYEKIKGVFRRFDC